MPVETADPVVTAACFFCCRRAMGEAITRHSLRPLNFWGRTRAKARAFRAARMLPHILSAVMPRVCGASSTPETYRLKHERPRILGRPVKPGDDIECCLKIESEETARAACDGAIVTLPWRSGR